jgi:peroxiredoxin
MRGLLLALLITLYPQAITAQALPAPAFTLKDLKGRSVRLSDYKGKVVLLNFWATWCAPCLAEMPGLARLQREYRRRGLQIIGVAYPDDDPRQIARVARQLRVPYPLLFGSRQTITSYQVSDVLPVTVIIDRNGNITDRILGTLEPDEFAGKVKPLLNSAVAASPAIARPG